jgi:uroporphyrinogen decarboxylase
VNETTGRLHVESQTSARIRSEDEVRAMTLAEKEDVIRRFNTRVDAAVAASPPSKERIRRALSRGGAARCPVRLRRLSLDVILRYGDELADLFCQYPDDAIFTPAYDLFIGYQPPERQPKLNAIQLLTEDAQWTDEWGTVWQHAAGGVGASTVSNPLADWSQLDEYLAKRMPDPRAPGRLDAVKPSYEMHAKTRYFGGMAHITLFERLHCLRGMENTFADFHVYPDEVDRLLDALTDYCVALVGQWGKLGVDGLFLTDDWGTQATLMISPAMWKKFFAVRYRRICDEAHRHGMHVVFHSCGNVAQIVGGLIDAGVDVLDPLQPEAIDQAEVARQFGGKVAFCGGISDQNLAVLTPQETRDHVRRTIDTLGSRFGNAYLVGPSNVLCPEVPLANIEALFEACHN